MLCGFLLLLLEKKNQLPIVQLLHLLLFIHLQIPTMFNFMKKDKEKKKDGKTKGVKELSSGGVVSGGGASATTAGLGQERLTSDDLLRLDEVRRSLKMKPRRKEKEKLPSGITADYTAHLGTISQKKKVSTFQNTS